MIKGLNDEDRREIVKYRLEKSLRTYNEAVGSIANGYVETAANRLYSFPAAISKRYLAMPSLGHKLWRTLVISYDPNNIPNTSHVLD